MTPTADHLAREERTIRVAYTIEQCWHEIPGGTAIAALRIARELRAVGVDLAYVAARHPLPPELDYRPDDSVYMLPLGRRSLYEAWTRIQWPKVEAVTGAVDVAHATGLIPCATSAPMVVTVHDVAFIRTPDRFTRYGARVMIRAFEMINRQAVRIITSSRASFDDLLDTGIDVDRLRIVPLGVDAMPATVNEVAAARALPGVPTDFVLFVGTIEPRKNLPRLAAAVASSGLELPLIVAGETGWGNVDVPRYADVRFVGHVDDATLRGLYAAASVFAYPSEREGFGLPVAEAMAQSTPVVTSAGTATEEVAGGAAVLVDPLSVDSIRSGLSEALDRREELAPAGRARAAELTWARSAAATLNVYRELV